MSEAWYRKLLAAAVVLGVGGGVVALVYSGVTNFGINLFYDEPTTEARSGQWWWVPLVSGGAVLVVALRGLWGVLGESLGSWSSSDVVMYQGIGGFDHYGIDRALWFGLVGFAKWSKTGMRQGSGDLVPPGTVQAFDNFEEYEPLPAEERYKLRAVIVDHDNDPVAQMSLRWAVKQPPWLTDTERGRNVAEGMQWAPLTTFVQIMVDAMNAMRVVPGEFKSFGHDYPGDTADFVHAAYRLTPVTDVQKKSVVDTLRHSSWSVVSGSRTPRPRRKPPVSPPRGRNAPGCAIEPHWISTSRRSRSPRVTLPPTCNEQRRHKGGTLSSKRWNRAKTTCWDSERLAMSPRRTTPPWPSRFGGDQAVRDHTCAHRPTDFKREKAEAWGSDLGFGHEYHDKIERMALVGDQFWGEHVAKIAQPFSAESVEWFDTDTDAWAWSKAEPDNLSRRLTTR